MRARSLTLLLALLGAQGCFWLDQEDREAWACDRWLEQGPWYVDVDRDGVGSAEATRADCPEMDLAAARGDDCDDQDASRFPGNPELCQDGIDQDCDGEDPQRTAWYPDEDLDGFGDEDGLLLACEQPEGTVAEAGDCDDADAATNPDAADAVCSDGIDQNCDGDAECLVSGDVDLSGGWSSWGLARTFTGGAPAGLAAGADQDGDGVADLGVGGESVAWLLTVGADREAEAARQNPGLGADESSGEAIALVQGTEAAALALGAPDWEGDGASGEGRVALVWGADDGQVGWIEAEEGSEQAGASLAAVGGTLALATVVQEDEDPLHPWIWSATLLSGDALPGAGETLRLDRAAPDAVVQMSWSLSRKEPQLALGASEDGLELALALGPSEVESATELIWFGGPLEGSISDDEAALSLLDTESDLGSSAALLDLDGDGALDLAAGSPDENEVQVFAGPAAETDETPEWRFEGTGAGGALAAAGDVDGDGTDDLLVGSPERETVWLVLGGVARATEALEAAATISGPDDSQLGASLAGGDLDGDGWSDISIGAPGSSSAYVLWGGP